VPRPADPSKSEEPAVWLKAEFERTALPYSCLAEYLGLDRSAVTKILNRDRSLGGEELGAARGYFTVVSVRDGPKYKEALGKLQSARTRRSIVSQMHEWLQVNEPAWTSGISFTLLIERGTGPNATLRADQIMAICRVLNIDINALAQNAGVQLNSDDLFEPTTKDAIEELSVAAAKWAAEAGVKPAYQFNRGRPSKINTQLTGRPAGLFVRKGPRADREFGRCEPFVIDGDDAAPLFRTGQTVYVEHRPSDLKSGDIVIVFAEEADATTATIGLFQFETNAGISIDIPNRGRANIPSSLKHLVGRVNFCRI
jgi:hypothetical protein